MTWTVGMAVAALLGLAALAPMAHGEALRLANGHRAGVWLRRGVTHIPGATVVRAPSPSGNRTASSNTNKPDNGTIDYNGGPVLHTSAPFLVYWDPNSAITAKAKSVIEQYFTDTAAPGVEASDTDGVTRQYYDTTGYAGQRQTFSVFDQVIDDPHPYPALDTNSCPAPSDGVTACVSDAQIQAELSRLIAADGLPTGVGPNAPIYFVITPAATNVCFTDEGGGACATNYFCAYHSYYTDSNTSSTVLYSADPLLDVEEGSKGCQGDGTSVFQEPNGDRADNEVDDMSHEFNETVSDPLISAWYSDTDGQEIADNCESYGASVAPADGENPNAYEPTLGGSESAGTLYDQLINGDEYYTQTIWSNGDLGSGGCEAQPSADPSLDASLSDTVPNPPAPDSSVGFDPTASNDGSGLSSWTLNYGDGSASTFVSDGSAPTTENHTYANPGTYTATLTLVDTHGNVSTASQTIMIAASVSVSVSVGCSPSPIVVDQGSSCTATVTNTASGATPTGPVSFSATGAGSFDNGSCTLSGSGASASCSVNFTPSAGDKHNEITATYNGDAGHTGNSGQTGLPVSTRTTSTAISCSPSSVPTGTASSCTITVSDTDGAGTPSAPTGNVKFTPTTNNTFSACTLTAATASSSTCTVSVTPTGPPQTHPIAAHYGGSDVDHTSVGHATIKATKPTNNT